MNIVLYARVSDPKVQDADDKVSIDQQLADMRALCARNDWQIVGEFVDREYYRATQSPKKGKMVNPSGERADRPEFLKMLEVVRTGEVDAVLCWRDDRLVRHPRVAVALEDALDVGDAQRTGRPKIEIQDATGAVIDRFTLSIKATIWREENKRRAERTRMGKVATLQQGRWPGLYNRYGYKTLKDDGRGRIIEIEETEAAVVRKIHEMYDAGTGVRAIRRYLIRSGAEQRSAEHEWSPVIIYAILRAEDYTGIATWNFSDGTSISIEIPAIIDRDLWKRNRARPKRNKQLSTRRAKGVYLLQGLLYCGDCEASMRVIHHRHKGKGQYYRYYCLTAKRYSDEPHPQPFSRSGPTLDWLVWRCVVDYGIRQPELIRKQVQKRQSELQAQGDSVEGDIAHARRRLEEIDRERHFCLRQAKKERITEAEFGKAMQETEEEHQYWESELARLQELRDNRAKVLAGLDYATELLTGLQSRLSDIDIPPDELRALSKEKQDEILKERRKIIRALCDKVVVYASGLVRIEGLLDGSEAPQFELAGSRPRLYTKSSLAAIMRPVGTTCTHHIAVLFKSHPWPAGF